MPCNTETAVLVKKNLLAKPMLDWDNPKEAFPQLTKDICMKQWGQYCLIVNKWTGRQLRVSIEQAFALCLCYGKFSLSQILDLVSYAFKISPTRAKQEIRPIFDKCLDKEMFAIGPLAQAGATKPLCDPEFILKEATKGKTPQGRRCPNPLFLVAVLTQKCDMRCIYCFRSAGTQAKSELNTQDWLNVVEQASDMGVVRCFVTGGEPTLHEGFVPLVSALLVRGIYPYISTNALYLNDKIIKGLVKSGLRRIQVSLDAAEEDLFYKMTGIQKGFEIVLDNIRKLSDAGIEVMVKSVVIPLNYKFAGKIIETCLDLGVRIVDFAPYGNAPFGRGGKELLLSDAQRKDCLSRLNEAEEHFGHRVTIMGTGLKKSMQWKNLPDHCTTCGGFISSMVIQPNGDVGPCELLPSVESLKIGNICQTSLKDLWNSQGAERIANPPKDELTDTCLECRHLSYCRGGCHAYALLYSDNPFAPDPHCPRVKLSDNPVLAYK
ncbi:MAG: radical SAM protein [Candidatus Omnitrophica bacterium]|nr:radical SAM protein [Candidatus Omnitrophota bacterium]